MFRKEFKNSAIGGRWHHGEYNARYWGFGWHLSAFVVGASLNNDDRIGVNINLVFVTLYLGKEK